MEEKKKETFKEECLQYLTELSLASLRGYGRFLNLPCPTNLKKAELILEILSVLCEEKKTSRTKRGAPIKNNYVQPEIVSKIEEIRRKVFGEDTGEQVETGNTVLLQFSVNLERLNNQQKQLLNEFLKTL